MALPLSLTGKYQLVVLGPEGDPQVTTYASRLDNAVNFAFSHLGVSAKKFLVRVMSSTNGPDIDRRMPSVAVFFGFVPSPMLSPHDTARLGHLLTDGTLIIPVVADTRRFSTLVPSQIAHLNGISLADCGTDFERLAARVLEGFGLLRERRRLFISYRRLETSGVAAQLYEALDAAGFDVFLDTHGVLRPGEPFQDILWHRLADTDVALLLDSPDFLASRWTEEELARANDSNLQILQVLWPGQTEVATAAFSTFHPLSLEDFERNATLGPAARLLDSSVGAIVDAVEGLRARAMGARHSFLVREFVTEARRAGLLVRTTLERTLMVSVPSGDTVLVQPAIGVPDAERYEILEQLHQRDISLGRTYSLPPVLLYDQTGIRARWLKHLSWLNGNLACARSVSLVDAKVWLNDLKAKGGVMNNVIGLRVFLSASVPLPSRDPVYFGTADVIAIRDAVRALTMVVVEQQIQLVFGGHPAISPMIRLQIAQTGTPVGDRVVMFQSRYFEREFPQDNAAFERVELVDAVQNNRQASLQRMREAMLTEPFRLGIFIGGMEGIEEEYDMFRRLHPSIPAFPIASTGAAAAMLFERDADLQRDHPELRDELSYLTLMRDLISIS